MIDSAKRAQQKPQGDAWVARDFLVFVAHLEALIKAKAV